MLAQFSSCHNVSIGIGAAYKLPGVLRVRILSWLNTFSSLEHNIAQN